MYSHQKVNQKPAQKAKIILACMGTVIGMELLVQFVWPDTILAPNVRIDDENFGLWDKTNTESRLDISYNDIPVEIYFGDNTESYITTSANNVGISVSNARRVSQINYPPQWRIVPTSLFWYGLLVQATSPQTTLDEAVADNFIAANFDKTHRIEPANADLVITEQSIDLKKSRLGGSYSLSELKSALKNPSFINRKAIIKVDIAEENPRVTDDDALKVATVVSGQLINDLVLTFEDYQEEITLPAATLRSWISFNVINNELTPVINEIKLNKFLADEVAPLIEKAAGTTTITTSDLADIERKEGDQGKVLNTVETALRLTEYLLGKRQSVVVAVESIDPTVEYVYERIVNEVQPSRPADEEDAADDESDEPLDAESLI